MDILHDTSFSILEQMDENVRGYEKTLLTHKANVIKAYEWLKKNLPELFTGKNIAELDQRIKDHDNSKFEPEEFSGYEDKWVTKQRTPKYEIAWEHHYKHNPHHPEYWNGKDMDYISIIEMICDWWSFSFRDHDLYSIFDFYENTAKDDKMKNISPKTKETVEAILLKMENKLHDLNENFSLDQQTSLLESFKFNIEIANEINKHDLDKAEELIKDANRILLVRHIAPDTDAKNSVSCLAEAIHIKYPNKNIIIGESSTNIELNSDDLLIILDLAVKSRIDCHYSGNPKIIRFDHHAPVIGDQIDNININIEDLSAGSTCEIISIFLDYEDYKINKNIAERLFAGIVADTGRFQYNIGSTVIAALNYLLEYKIDYKKIYENMYLSDEKVIKTKAYLLQNYRTTPNGVAYIFLDKNLGIKDHIDIESASRMVFELDGMKASPIWMTIIERGKNQYLRVRSRNIDLRPIAEKYNGGGHDNAVGIKVDDRNKVKEILRDYDALLESKKKNLVLRESEFSDDLTAIYGNPNNETSRISKVLNDIKDITYGFISTQDGSRIDNRDWIHHCHNIYDYYQLNWDPEITLKNKLGICMDQSLAVKYLFNKYYPEMKCQIYALTKGRYIGHAVPCFCDNGSWYYLENAWDKEKGLHGPYASQIDLETYLKNMYYQHHKDDNDEDVVVMPFEQSEYYKTFYPAKQQIIMKENTNYIETFIL
jgi:phosphoesterase RecJ-like protein